MKSRRCLHVNSRSIVVAGKDGVVAKLLLNTKDLVEFRKTLRTSRRTSFLQVLLA